MLRLRQRDPFPPFPLHFDLLFSSLVIETINDDSASDNPVKNQGLTTADKVEYFLQFNCLVGILT